MSKTARLMKDSGIEWIGEIPVGWEVIKTKFAASLYTGNSIKDEEKGLYEDPANAIPYIATKDIDVSNNSVDYVNGMFVKTSDSSFVRASSGDTLMCIEGGSAGRKKAKIDREVCFVNKLCCFHAEHIDSHYLFFVLNSPHYESEFQINLEGLIGGVSKSKLRNFLLPLPPLPEQQKIADYLDEKCGKIDLVIAKSEEIIEKLKAYKLSLITETVTKGLDPNAPMKDSGIEWIGEIPRGWEVRRLKSLFSFGKGLPITKENLIDNGVSVISYGQIHAKFNTGIKPDSSLIRYVSEDYLTSNPESLTSPYDFIFADTSEDLDGCGNCVYLDGEKEIFAGYHTIIFRSKYYRSNKYLAYLFQSDAWRSQIRNRVAGVKLYSISRKILSCVDVIFPPLPEQQKIADYLNAKCAAIDKNIADRQTLIEKLTAYKKSLIYEAVTGKKEI